MTAATTDRAVPLWSLIKLQGLYFTNPAANRSAYFGGGFSYGRDDIWSDQRWQRFEERPRRRAASGPDGWI